MYQTENDYWRIREFLREVSLLNDRHDYSWCLLRWDYWVWHVNLNIFHIDLCAAVHLWEVDGQIVAMLNPDTPGEAFFQFHPAYRHLRQELLDYAEAHLAETADELRRRLRAGEPHGGWLSADVADFIGRQGLYRGDPAPAGV